MNSDMNTIMQIIRSGGNPQSLLTNIVQQKAQSVPMMNNLLNMMNCKNFNGIEMMARNICKEKGYDPDQMFKQIMH